MSVCGDLVCDFDEFDFVGVFQDAGDVESGFQMGVCAAGVEGGGDWGVLVVEDVDFGGGLGDGVGLDGGGEGGGVVRHVDVVGLEEGFGGR